ncbi:energy transducer TonB [Klebsiella michiganensis]|nr:TonB family protein [Klebsiella michiganensis]
MKKITLFVYAALVSNLAFASEYSDETKPVRISCPTPYYPASAAAQGVNGTVKFTASVNEKGEVYSIQITGDEIFFRETKSAVRKCKYEPGRPGIARGTINFRLSRP